MASLELFIRSGSAYDPVVLESIRDWDDLLNATPSDFRQVLGKLDSSTVLESTGGFYADALWVMDVNDAPTQLQREHAAFAAAYVYTTGTETKIPAALNAYAQLLIRFRDRNYTTDTPTADAGEIWINERIRYATEAHVYDPDKQVSTLLPDKVEQGTALIPTYAGELLAVLMVYAIAVVLTDVATGPVSEYALGVVGAIYVTFTAARFGRSIKNRERESWQLTADRLTELARSQPLADSIAVELKLWEIAQVTAVIADPEDRAQAKAEAIWEYLEGQRGIEGDKQ